jgi:hypothetical protein
MLFKIKSKDFLKSTLLSKKYYKAQKGRDFSRPLKN